MKETFFQHSFTIDLVTGTLIPRKRSPSPYCPLPVLKKRDNPSTKEGLAACIILVLRIFICNYPASYDAKIAFISDQISPGLGANAALKWMAENNMVMVYDKLHLTLAEGDKVLCVSEGKFGAVPGEHVAFYDIFRFENGKIVEHWDNIQAIPADGEWANPNGKSGF